MEEKSKGFRIGPIRPPSEANSLLLQVTNGCTWNKCKFCQLYRHTKFKAYSADSIKQDIDNMVFYKKIIQGFKDEKGNYDIEGINRYISLLDLEEQQCFYMLANWILNGDGSVFLQDGNTTALSSGRLSDVLIYLKEAFPEIKRITSYGRAQNLAKNDASYYAELKEAGLDRIHSGYESGSDKVLELVNKGVTQAEEITAGKNVKAGGIEFSVYFMPGLGGKELSHENAKGMSEVLNEINADFIRIRTCAIKPGTGLYDDWVEGKISLAYEDDKVNEIRYLIENAENINTNLVSDHIINLLQEVEGNMEFDKDNMLSLIDNYLSMDKHKKMLYQAARRTLGILGPSYMKYINGYQMEKLENMISAMDSDEEWEIALNGIISNYI